MANFFSKGGSCGQDPSSFPNKKYNVSSEKFTPDMISGLPECETCDERDKCPGAEKVRQIKAAILLSLATSTLGFLDADDVVSAILEVIANRHSLVELTGFDLERLHDAESMEKAVRAMNPQSEKELKESVKAAAGVLYEKIAEISQNDNGPYGPFTILGKALQMAAQDLIDAKMKAGLYNKKLAKEDPKKKPGTKEYYEDIFKNLNLRGDGGT